MRRKIRFTQTQEIIIMLKALLVCLLALSSRGHLATDDGNTADTHTPVSFTEQQKKCFSEYDYCIQKDNNFLRNMGDAISGLSLSSNDISYANNLAEGLHVPFWEKNVRTGKAFRCTHGLTSCLKK